MIPTIDLQHFPVFMPDQVLTSQNLNDLFNYQDEQGRMTRSNLIGIGIVCGLEIKTGTDANGSYIVITKGTGVTSEGYLVTVPETKYHSIINFNSEQCRYYEPFVNLSTKKERFPMWELKQLSEVTGTKPLASIPNGLNDKVVMLFVELLETNNKNCDPNSCDDKGINVQVNFRPLLVRKIDAAGLITTTGTEVPAINFNDLIALRMPRWDVPNTLPVSSNDILKAYRKILTPSFIQTIETALTEAYKEFRPLIVHEYPSDPFVNLAEKFAFLQNPALTTTQVLHIQYYYDFFSDLLQAYDEFCKTCKTIHSACCPDQRLFPRHLLLGEVVPPADDTPSEFRHFFIYSPLFECKHLIFNLRTLFERMDVMVKSFDTPTIAAADGNVSNDLNIRVTPCILGCAPLSEKAIPYYYKINLATFNLYKYWNADKKWRNHVDQVLSYHAAVYSKLPHIKEPLRYDLEPYNFLRVEGIVGKPITNVLRNVQKRIDDNRLPIQVMALKTGDVDTSGTMPEQMVCETRDLELNYDVVRREWEAVIGKTIEYIDDIAEKVKELLGANRAKLLQDFKIDLHLAKTYLVDDLPAFAAKYEDFMEVFERIEATAQTLHNQFINLLDQQTIPNATSKLLEDIIDHLDEVIMSCRKGAFRAIYQEYKKRLGDIFGKQFFGYYSKHNPGIQHKAGASTGGTFILVYHTKPKPAELQFPKGTVFTNGSFVVKGKITDSVGGALMNVQVFERTSGAKTVTISNGNYSLKLSKMPAIINVKATGYQPRQLIVQNISQLYDFKLVAIDIKDTGYDNIDEGIVIADFFLPYSCCSDCTPVQFAVQDPPANKPPIARAGDDISIRLPINEVEIDGRNSEDPEGRLKSYQWIQKIGPSQAVITDATLALTLVDNLILGEYVFELTVTDDEGAISTDTVTITVLEALNIPPVVNAGLDATIQLPAILTLTGTASDADGPLPIVKWSIKPGSPLGATFADINNTTTQVNGLVAGTYTFILTATDSRNESRSDEVVITVQPVNQAPKVTAMANNTQITLPPVGGGSGISNVQLTGTADDPDKNNPLTLLWTLESGNALGAAIQTTNGLVTTVLFSLPGIYTFKLTATDTKNATGSAQVTITVLAANRIPQVNVQASPTQLTLPPGGGTVISQLTGATNDPDIGDIVTVLWSIVSTPINGATIQNATNRNASVTFSQTGTYIVRLTANDNKGGMNFAQTTIVVSAPVNQPPTAAPKADPISVDMDDSYIGYTKLDGSNSKDPEGGPLTYAWSFTGGLPHQVSINEPNKSNSKVIFIAPGTFKFVLNVTDDKGTSHNDSVQVVVNSKQISPNSAKNCGSFGEVLELFKGIQNDQITQPLNMINAGIRTEIVNFFKLAVEEKIEAEINIKKQLDFFVRTKIESLLKGWVDTTGSVMKPQKDVLTPLTRLLNLYAKLAYYIACIQTSDVDATATSVRMSEGIKALETVAKDLRGMGNKLNEVDQKILYNILSATTKLARVQVINGKENTAKPNYLLSLGNIIITLDI